MHNSAIVSPVSIVYPSLLACDTVHVVASCGEMCMLTCFSDSPRYDTGSIETEDVTVGVGESQPGWFRSATVVSHR